MKRAISTFVVGVVYLAYFLATAGVAQLQLIAGTSSPAISSGILSVVSIAAFFAVPAIIATGLIPAVVLHAVGVRYRWPYLANAVISAAFAAYSFAFNFGIADNLGAILLHVPKNGRDMSDGWVYQAPSFTTTMANAFRDLPLFWQEWQFLVGVFVFALVVSVICANWFWHKNRASSGDSDSVIRFISV